jgi:Domain of Unknown Function with PDB structure (DUF3857)
MKSSPKTPILITLAICAAALFLSSGAPAKDDWLPIDPADLALKDNPQSPGAHAMILYREDFINAESRTVDEYWRTKIFTEEGKTYGSVEIEFRKDIDEVTNVRARTIRPDGSIVNYQGQIYEKEIVKAGGRKYLAKTFSLPEVQPGCIIEYKYRRQFNTDYYWSLEWRVQEELFTRDAKFSIVPPTSYRAPILYWREYRIPTDSKPARQKDGAIMMEIHNLAGLEEEPYMPPDSVLRARVAFYYRSQEDPQNETPEQFWKRVSKLWYERMERFVDKKSALQAIVSQCVSPNDPPDVKLRKLYARAQQLRNTSYDLRETRQEEKRDKQKENNNVEDALKRGYADGTEINEFFVGLARAAGFESSMVYVAPRNVNAFYPNMLDASQLSANIVWVHVGNQNVYLDPASKYYAYPYLPWYETAVQGLRLEKQGPVDTTVPITQASDAVRERHVDVHLLDDGTLEGKLELTYSGQWACAKREGERQEDEAGRIKSITDEVKRWLPSGATFDDVNVTGWDKLDEPLRFEGTLRIPGFASAAGRRALVRLTVFQSDYATSFQTEKRSNPIYFHFPATEKDTFTLHLPGAFKVETLPTAGKASPGGGFEYSVQSNQDGDVVKIERRMAIGGMLFPASNYTAIRTFFNTVKTDDDGQIVLQPAQTAKGN